MFLALNKAYKSCLGASEGTLPLHPWQSVLTHLQIISLPPFTLPTCSDTIPHSTHTSFQGKGERIHVQISCITFRNGVICEEFLSCCRTECPTSWWLYLRYKQVSTLKSGNNFKNVSLARSSDGDILLVHIHKNPRSVLSAASTQSAFTHHHSIQSFLHNFKKLFSKHLLNLEKKWIMMLSDV